MQNVKKKIIIVLLLVIILLTANTGKTSASSSYINPEKEFRAVWISNFVGDVSSYSSEAAFKAEMNRVFTIMEHYNLNAMIFHIRTHNNALYNSRLNPKASWWRNVNFDVFDPLEWLIDECHKRGIEFHAWMNPYRVNSSFYAESLPEGHPAKNSENLLTYSGNTILNPGLPNVRQFLIETCLEVIENYDVDAIHFDDYFYTNLGANGKTSGDNTILDEPDQNTFKMYNGSYSITNALDKAEWRREQINFFIRDLHGAITDYNERNNRYVQLGIAPTGIYRNGNGVVNYDSNGKPITNGSHTTGQEHYNSYLFCDSLKWCVEGWIDYIIPQSYWAQDHPAGAYEKVMDWWNKVVKNLDVNLYSGIGLYMADEDERIKNTYGWQKNLNELYEQLLLVSGFDNVKGASLYKFSYLRDAYNGISDTKSYQQLTKLGSDCWNKKVLLPEIKSMGKVTLPAVNNFRINNKVLTWDLLPQAKFYALYRASGEVTFSQNELVGIVGGNVTSWTDTVSGNYQYGIKPISYTNTLGASKITELYNLPLHTDTGASKGTEVTNNNGVIDGKTIQKGYTRNIALDLSITDQSMLNYTWTSSNESVATVNQNGVITALSVGNTIITGVYKNDSRYVGFLEITVYDKYTVNFIDWDNTVISSQIVINGSNATKPNDPSRVGYTFLGWDKSYTNVNSNLDIHAIYQIKTYNVKFVDDDGKILSTQTVEHGASATPPVVTGSEYHIFEGWSTDFNNVTQDLVITAIYRDILYSIKVLTNNDSGSAIVHDNENSKAMADGDYGFTANLEAIETTGEFLFWMTDGKIISFNKNVPFTATKNHSVMAYFAPQGKYAVTYLDSNMSLVDLVFVNPNESVTTDKSPSTKPGYTFSGWEDGKIINNHTFIYATYTKINNLLNVTINNGNFKDTNENSKMISYGQIVTIECKNSDFSYWMINNQIVSYQNIYTFSVYQDTVIDAVLDGHQANDFHIYLNKPLFDSSTNKVAFYGKFDNPYGYELVEVGIIYVEEYDVDPLTNENAKKERILRYSGNNEFSVFIKLEQNEAVSACFYAVTDQGEYIYHYSQKQTFINGLAKGNITYNLNGGAFYKYATREAMINDFISDYNQKFQTSITAETFFGSTFSTGVYSLFSDPNYQEKWMWLKDYIIEVCERNNYNDLLSLKNGTENLWRSNLHAFFNKNKYATWPYSYDFSNQIDYNGFWNKIELNVPNTYVIGEVYTLPIPYKVGYTFYGWYDNPDFTGNVVYTIKAGETGNKIYYAKWI